MKKTIFILFFLLEVQLLSGSAGIIATIDLRLVILAPVVVIGSFVLANKYMKEFFGCHSLEKIVMQFILGVMELIAAFLIGFQVSLLAACGVVAVSSFANIGFVVVRYCLFVFSIIVMVISLFRMWICIFRMWRNNDYEY